MMGNQEFGVCSFCKQKKVLSRTYLFPSRYRKPGKLEDRKDLHNQGDYFVILWNCTECGPPVTDGRTIQQGEVSRKPIEK